MTTPEPSRSGPTRPGRPGESPPPNEQGAPGGIPAYPEAAGDPLGDAAAAGRPGGPGGGRAAMPGRLRVARGLVLVVGGLLTLVVAANLAVSLSSPEDFERQLNTGGTEVSAGAAAAVLSAFLVFFVAGLVLAALFGRGGSGVRIGALVWCGFAVVVGLVSYPPGLLLSAAALVATVLLAHADSAAWFRRER